MYGPLNLFYIVVMSMVQNNSRSKAMMSSVTHPLQHFSRTDHV